MDAAVVSLALGILTTLGFRFSALGATMFGGVPACLVFAIVNAVCLYLTSRDSRSSRGLKNAALVLNIISVILNGIMVFRHFF
jgi:hypothetical protein